MNLSLATAGFGRSSTINLFREIVGIIKSRAVLRENTSRSLNKFRVLLLSYNLTNNDVTDPGAVLFCSGQINRKILLRVISHQHKFFIRKKLKQVFQRIYLMRIARWDLHVQDQIPQLSHLSEKKRAVRESVVTEKPVDKIGRASCR